VSIRLKHHQLACFLAVVEERSFTRAADRLAVSQPALSRTIRLMEDIIGARLFDRDTRNVSLTPVGRELTTLARRVVSEIDGIAGELARFVEGRRGRVTVAALPSVAAALLPQAIVAFSTASPEVDIRIRDGLSERVLAAVETGEADFGLTVQSQPNGNLKHTPLCSDEFGLVCRNEDPLLQATELTWAVFKDRPFIAMASDSSVRRATDAAFLQAGIQATSLFECSSLSTTGHLIAQGMGISALPRLTLPLIGVANLAWRRLEAPLIVRMIGIVVRSDRTLSPAAIKFLRMVEKVGSELTLHPTAN
jgi:DNA-binding transcriptional LysR family regulator